MMLLLYIPSLRSAICNDVIKRLSLRDVIGRDEIQSYILSLRDVICRDTSQSYILSLRDVIFREVESSFSKCFRGKSLRACLITLHSNFEIFQKGHPVIEFMLDRRIFER